MCAPRHTLFPKEQSQALQVRTEHLEGKAQRPGSLVPTPISVGVRPPLCCRRSRKGVLPDEFCSLPSPGEVLPLMSGSMGDTVLAGEA